MREAGLGTLGHNPRFLLLNIEIAGLLHSRPAPLYLTLDFFRDLARDMTYSIAGGCCDALLVWLARRSGKKSARSLRWYRFVMRNASQTVFPWTSAIFRKPFNRNGRVVYGPALIAIAAFVSLITNFSLIDAKPVKSVPSRRNQTT
jgi:hypothetical protein